ncbi:GIY-YIG nuclease family protein [Bradyrhizobium sp. 83012]|uniref:GIY-YIG nuclease family protein n=1 Tax=Bradyrhizobium aeschynomenes TaxID=2734909 RepID=A0ABX2C8L8_9BRAD|nr:GIY-YIG nuclease family protein [Bradyrhizobium aeschynomenes]
MAIAGRRRTDPQGFVYIVTNPAWPSHCKIGKALVMKDRIKVYQTGSPYRDYRVVAHAYFADRKQAEAELHQELKGHRIGKTEWFFIHPEDACAMLRRISRRKRKHERKRSRRVVKRPEEQVRHRRTPGC